MAITTLAPDKPLKTEVKIINTGRTVALDLTSSGRVQTSFGPLNVEEFVHSKNMLQPADATRAGALFQNVDVTIPAQTSTPLTSEQVEAIKTRQLWVYLFGDIHYKDVFGKPHTTQYCGIYVPDTEKLEACGLHDHVY